MIYSREVEEMCPVAQGVHHGAAPAWRGCKKSTGNGSSGYTSSGTSYLE